MTRTISRGIALSTVLALAGPAAAGPPDGPLTKCPADSVVSGTVCIDRYEASVWRVPSPTTTNKSLVKKIQQGKATLENLVAAGATQLGLGSTDDFTRNYAPCADDGQNCADDIYAVSLPGVIPSARMTWFQAQAACENARKRLPTNAEWQAAVAGTPDPGPDDGSTDCNTLGGTLTGTGSRSACVSSRGVFDMVGNVSEWVADWVPLSTACGSWSAGISATGDRQCLGGPAAPGGEPGALQRGGFFFGFGTLAGPLSVETRPLSDYSFRYGFRCAR